MKKQLDRLKTNKTSVKKLIEDLALRILTTAREDKKCSIDWPTIVCCCLKKNKKIGASKMMAKLRVGAKSLESVHPNHKEWFAEYYGYVARPDLYS